MRPLAFSSLSLAVALLAGCSDRIDAPKPPYDVRAIDLGGGYLALLSAAGPLRIVKDGEIVLATAPNVPLFAAIHDPDQPSVWHDPTSLPDLPLTPIAVATIEATSPAPGELHLVVPDQGPDTALVTFALARDDGFATALGERFDHVAANGANVPLFLAIDGASDSGTNEAHVPVPFLLSSKGYGVFIASREAGAFDLGAADPGVVRATFEGRALDVTLFVDPDPLAIARTYAKKTGLPRRVPTWALAPMFWRNEWPDAATLLADADEYRKRKIPMTTLWIDNPWQTAYNTAKLDPKRFGDPKALMRAIADRGYKTIAWSTPYLERPEGTPQNEAQELYRTADQNGWFVQQDTGGTWPAIGCCHKGLGMIDFTNPAATAFWQSVLKSATDAGFSGFKLDYGEDLVPDFVGARLGTLRFDGETERTGRTYPLGYHAAYHGALDAVRPDGFLIGRASSYGGQTHVDAIWPGDLNSGFEKHEGGKVGGLPAAIVAAQTLSVSGFPAFGSDTGGYRDGPPTREAELRWAEQTAFSVVMQNGGGGDSHNPWMYDDAAAALFQRLAQAHAQLVPYLEHLVDDAATNGTPTIRPLPIAYPKDSVAAAFADDEYLLGPDVLVAPIVEQGATKRFVHFPPGAWLPWFGGAIADGPSEASIDAPLGTPPVFVRAGALIPLDPPDVDTLVDARAAGVVTRAARASEADARAFVNGSATTTFDGGSAITLEDRDDAATITWSPVAPARDLVIEVELARSRVGAGSVVLGNAGPVAHVTTDVRACASSCWSATSPTSLRARLAGPLTLVIKR